LITPLATIPVGVLVERSKSSNQWSDYYWRAVGVLAGQPETPAWTKLSDDGERATFYAGTAEIELYRTETTYYRSNLESGAPAVWVALRAADGDPPFIVAAVTADPAEGESLTETATDLIEQVTDGVAVLTLNRPDRLNAMSRPMLDALLEALPRLADDPEIGVVVLAGAGRGFCAGGDVKAMAEGTELGGQTMEEKAQALRSRMETSRWLHEMAKPTIAMMRGPAAGAGLSLAMACDLRIASDTVRLGTAFARVGYSGDFGGSYYLTQLVGTAKARELYFTADLLDAQQALGLGLVNRVVADARLEEETMALASRLARGPRVAYRYMKRNMNAAETASLKDMLDLEAWHHTRTGMTEDHREAARAFVEKREPQFKGK